MALNSDAQGFLVGHKVDLSGFGNEMDALKDDVRGIRNTLLRRRDRDTVVNPGRNPEIRLESAPTVAPIATPKRRNVVATPGSVMPPPAMSSPTSAWPSRSAAARVTEAASEAAKVVVNDESDASVKAFNEIAQPLKRGWTALRGNGAGSDVRQEGWLKRIFNALRGRKVGRHEAIGASRQAPARATHFERAREHAVTRDVDGRDREVPDAIGRDVARASEGKGRSAPVAPSGWQGGTGTILSLRAIERHLKSLDGKVKAPKGEGLFMRILPIFSQFLPALFGWLRERRMDSNLDRIEDHTRKQLAVSMPFYAFVRRRLIAIGEAIEEPEHAERGGLLRRLLAPLLTVLAGLSARLAGIPLIGPALAGLTRRLGGRVAPMVSRGGATPAPAGSPAPVAATSMSSRPVPARWGRAQTGMRGRRVVRTSRVLMRNAGRAMRPLGRVLTKVPVLGSLLAVGMGVAGSVGIERDASRTRDQKNAAQGKTWGGVAGGLGGAALGAALGTAIAPGIGTVIGGVLGAVLGEWLGGNLGELLGEKFSAFMAPVSPVFDEIKLWALATWDWIRDGASAFFAGAQGVFTRVGTWLQESWGKFVETVTDGFGALVGHLKTVLNALKEVPVLGDAIRAAEAGAKVVAQTAKGTAKEAVALAGRATTGATQMAGQAWRGTVDALKARVPKGIRDRVAHARALETAASYKQGNIGGLDDAHTRELVASTAYTESAGGKLDMMNWQGYAGRYQAGAAWLADAGLIRGGSAAVSAAMKRDGFSREWDWATSGGMRRFLRNDANWNNGLSLQKYLASAEVQDGAFKTNSDQAYAQLVKEGLIRPGDAQGRIAGLLKARHLSGLGGARAVARGRTGPADANGTSAKKYYNDLAGANAHFGGVFTGVANAAVLRAPSAPVVASTRTPAPPPPPPAPAIADAPQVQVPLGSSAASKPVVVQVASPDAGQDVRDRGIAHIVTGGLSRG